VYTKIGLHSYNRLLGLELGPRVAYLGQRSIMNNLLRYKLIAKYKGSKSIKIVQDLKSQKEKLCKEKEILKNLRKK